MRILLFWHMYVKMQFFLSFEHYLYLFSLVSTGEKTEIYDFAKNDYFENMHICMQYVTKRTFWAAWCFWWILWTWQQRCFRSYVKSENVTIITQVIDVEGTTKNKLKERPNSGGVENNVSPSRLHTSLWIQNLLW